MLAIYQNSNADNYESIKAGFIVRKLEYETIISSLEKRKTGDSIQHELILGRRGSGKSTLLKRIEVEIAENKKLNTKYIPVNLAEEQAGIYRLMDLWEQVLQELFCQNDEKQAIKSFSEFVDEQTFTRYLYGEIHNFCETKKKKAALLLDNFDRIVGNFSDDGNLLRETLINYNDLVLIAASTRMDEHFWQYDKPFYEFFRRHHLDTLSSAETFLLLNHWSNSLDFDDSEKEKIKNFLKKYPGKVESIRLLTDGLPRTMLFFLKLVLQTEKPVEVDFLKKVMDEVTPLYQERLQNQTPPMRKVILEIAFMWEAVSTKEVAEQCRMESNLVSANLNTLTDRNIVEIVATGKRNNLYRISERFFNMWLIVTQGNPDQKRKARWISEFLESWYDKHELQNIALQHVKNLKTGKISGEEALILSKGLSQSKYISTPLRDEIIDLTKAELKDPLDNYLIQLPERTNKISKKIENYIEHENHQQGICLANTIENEDGIQDFLLASIYDGQEKYDLAEKHWLLAIEKGFEQALFNLGLLYYNQEKYDLAERYWLLAIKKGEENAIFNLGSLYYNQEKYDLAEKYWLLAIEKGFEQALFSLGLLYDNQEKYDLAEKHYLQATNKGHKSAMYNLGLLYDNQGKYDLAEKYYLLATDEGHKSAMFNMALMYYNQNRNKKQAKQYICMYEEEDISKIIIEIWAGVFNSLEERAITFCRKEKEDKFFIERLLIHHQKSLVHKLFHNAEFGKRLQEQYTVLYYVSQILNGKENENNLRLRIPPEVESTVEDVLQKIKAEQERYSK